MFSYYSYLLTSLMTAGNKFYSFHIPNTFGYLDDFKSQDVILKYAEEVPVVQLKKDICDSYFDEIGVSCNDVILHQRKTKNKVIYHAHSDTHIEYNADLFFAGFAEIQDSFRKYTNNFYDTKSGDSLKIDRIEITLTPKSSLAVNIINGFLCNSMYWGIILVTYFIFVHLLNTLTYYCENPSFILSRQHIEKMKNDFLFASFILPITIFCIIFGYYLIMKKIFLFIKKFMKECFYKRILIHKLNKYMVEHEIKEEGHSCSICLNDIEVDGMKTDCNHIFHKDCIGKWLYIKNSCPLCRTEIII